MPDRSHTNEQQYCYRSAKHVAQSVSSLAPSWLRASFK